MRNLERQVGNSSAHSCGIFSQLPSHLTQLFSFQDDATSVSRHNTSCSALYLTIYSWTVQNSRRPGLIAALMSAGTQPATRCPWNNKLTTCCQRTRRQRMDTSSGVNLFTTTWRIAMWPELNGCFHIKSTLEDWREARRRNMSSELKAFSQQTLHGKIKKHKHFTTAIGVFLVLFNWNRNSAKKQLKTCLYKISFV